MSGQEVYMTDCIRFIAPGSVGISIPWLPCTCIMPTVVRG